MSYNNPYNNQFNQPGQYGNPMPWNVPTGSTIPNNQQNNQGNAQSFNNPQQQMFQAQMPAIPSFGLTGRVVNDFSEITVNDVPMTGNAAFFPKADGSEIQVRSWTQDGRIQTDVYRLYTEELKEVPEENTEKAYFETLGTDMRDFREEISKRLDSLEESLAKSLTKSQANQSKSSTKTTQRQKKEVVSDE